MASSSVVLLYIFAIIGIAFSASIGDRLVHTAFSYKEFPLTISSANPDWVQSGPCVPGRGLPFVSAKNGVSSNTPVILFFTKYSGQLSGFQLRRFQPSEQNLAGQYWEAPSVDTTCTSATCSDLFVVFRDPATVCSNVSDVKPSAPSAFSLGDRVLVGSKQLSIALNGTVARSNGWMEGNCINHMGIHHSLDLATGKPYPPGTTWSAASMFPVIPMYNAQTGFINAILIANPHLAKTFPFGWWEGPFINMLFCKNWCSGSGCGFSDTSVWTTMHFFFRDPNTYSCTGAKCSLSGDSHH